jgi:NAD(P)-dependent dehydrogenase (short-subunit alcohol dehydrogenase family)
METGMYMDKFSLSGRRAVVTGGGRGIGAAISWGLAEAGAEIVIVDIDAQSADGTTRKLAEAGHKASYRQADLTRSDVVNALAEEVRVSAGPIDILVNNAGVIIVADAIDTTDDAWRRTMSVNIDAAFFCSRAFGSQMVARRTGAIVNVGSICGAVATVPQNSVPYIASKGALHMLTKSLACAWAPHNVRVNAVAPGYIETEMTGPFRESNRAWFDRWTDMTPMGRLGRPDEVAAAVLFLASDAASYCNGSVLFVDGAYTSL